LVIENIDVRRCDGAVFASHSLRVTIVEIGKIEVPVFRPDLHLLRRISHIVVASFGKADQTIGLNRDQSDAPLAVVGRNLLDPALINFGRRAVVAREHHNQHLCGIEILEAIGLPIHGIGQREVRGFRANFQDRWKFGLLTEGRRGCEEQQDYKSCAQAFRHGRRLPNANLAVIYYHGQKGGPCATTSPLQRCSRPCRPHQRPLRNPAPPSSAALPIPVAPSSPQPRYRSSTWRRRWLSKPSPMRKETTSPR